MNESQGMTPPDPYLSVDPDLWRKVIAAAVDYESHLARGMTSTPEEFAAAYDDIPSELLVCELHRMLDEFRSGETCWGGEPPNRYSDLRLLKSGGMGEIYQAVDLECNRLVAIKKIRCEYQEDPVIRSRFRAEAELTASLEHPGVIPIYGQGIDPQGRDYYAMRLIAGEGCGAFSESIRSFHRRFYSGPKVLSWHLKSLIRRLVDIADTVAYAHSQNVVHRDLKPSNVLIGPYGETLIADWGLARKVDQATVATHESSHARPPNTSADASLPTQGVGTPGYIAPEAEHGPYQKNPFAADIYSLGAILHCILTNRPPAMHQEIETTTTESIDLSSVPAITSLRAIANKATSLEWTDRYPNVESFRSDLLCWNAGEPVSARPEKWWEKAIRWPSRHRIAATGIATGLAICLLGGFLFLLYQTKQKQNAIAQSKRLQIALDESSRLLGETLKANEIAEGRRIEAFNSRLLAERREDLAYDGLLKFQKLLVTNQEIFQSPALAQLNDTLASQSKSMLLAIVSNLQQDRPPNPSSVKRLGQMACRLAYMELNLNQPDKANELLEQTSASLQTLLEDPHLPTDTQNTMHLMIGEMKCEQGAIQMTLGKLKEAAPFFEQTVGKLEPLLTQEELQSDQLHMARSITARAWSYLAMVETHQGNLNQAQTMQQKALGLFDSEQPRNYGEALARVQVHGNMSILQERSGAIQEALDHLLLAAEAVDEAFGMLDENPTGFDSGTNSLAPPFDLIEMRSQIHHERARLIIAHQNQQSAIPVLNELFQKEISSLRQIPQQIKLVGTFQRTATTLQLLLAASGDQQRAIEISDLWTSMAEQLVALPIASQPHWMLLINAHHTAGHMLQQFHRNQAATERYQQALESCQEAVNRDIRTPDIVYQRVELQMHLFQLLLQEMPFAEVEKHFSQAAESAKELLSLPSAPESLKEAAIDQLQRGIASMRSAQQEEAAIRWQDQLPSDRQNP
ncbi:MAG: serine/threonine-protein kinase [Pirellulaceae bacterium]